MGQNQVMPRQLVNQQIRRLEAIHCLFNHDHNHQTSGNSNSVIPSYAKMKFSTFNCINNTLIWAHRCEQFGPHENGNSMGALVNLQQIDRGKFINVNFKLGMELDN